MTATILLLRYVYTICPDIRRLLRPPPAAARCAILRAAAHIYSVVAHSIIIHHLLVCIPDSLDFALRIRLIRDIGCRCFHISTAINPYFYITCLHKETRQQHHAVAADRKHSALHKHLPQTSNWVVCNYDDSAAAAALRAIASAKMGESRETPMQCSPWST